MGLRLYREIGESIVIGEAEKPLTLTLEGVKRVRSCSRVVVLVTRDDGERDTLKFQRTQMREVAEGVYVQYIGTSPAWRNKHCFSISMSAYRMYGAMVGPQ